MTGFDLQNRHEKSSASGPTSFSDFLLSKSKFSGKDVMLFNDIYVMYICTFQKIISDHPEVPSIVKVKMLHVPFVMPQDIIFKIFPIVCSHT